MKRAGLARLAGLALGAGLVLAPAFAHAQASQAEMQAFPMPPPTGLHAQKAFGYVGDYGYYTAPPSAVYGMEAKAKDYQYVRYTGVSGKRVFVYGAWGTTPIAPPANGGDNCGHAHASWGAWAKYRIVLPLYGTIQGWAMAGGGGMSGVRNAQNKCVFKTDGPLAGIDPRFGWGATFKELDWRNTTFYTELVVGALSNTHGWGTCAVPSGQFPACKEPSYVIGYTLP